MVTHERPLAERFATRIAVLSDGRLVSDTEHINYAGAGRERPL